MTDQEKTTGLVEVGKDLDRILKSPAKGHLADHSHDRVSFAAGVCLSRIGAKAVLNGCGDTRGRDPMVDAVQGLAEGFIGQEGRITAPDKCSMERVRSKVSRMAKGPDQRDAASETRHQGQEMIVRQKADDGIVINGNSPKFPEVMEQVFQTPLLDEDRSCPGAAVQAPLKIPFAPEEEPGLESGPMERTAPVFGNCGRSGEPVARDEKGDSHFRERIP